MNVSFDESPWPDEHFATVGVFDGLHRGHQEILRSLNLAARRAGVPSALYTFQPRPVTVFAPQTPPDELTPTPRKLRLIAELGVDRVVVIRFSRAVAAIAAERFLVDVLGAGSRLRGLWVGHDFRFGRGREGDWGTIRKAALRWGFESHRVGPVTEGESPVSSSRIRERLRAGAVEEAARLLGRWPDMEGTVVPGRGEGRKLLVPTANLRLSPSQCLPMPGVYAGLAEWRGEAAPAVMNLGRRPTLTGDGNLVAEVHVIDRDEDLMGRALMFQIRTRLREERRFPSLEDLRGQVSADIARTRELAVSWRNRESGLAGEASSW